MFALLALLALIAFILSPFIDKLGPWPTVTIGLALLALHLLWAWTPWVHRATT